MLNKIKEFFLGKPKAPAPEAPYKVEAPSTNWPFPRASEIAPAPTPVVETAPAKKPRAPAKPKAAPAVKSAVAAKKPRTRKTPAK